MGYVIKINPIGFKIGKHFYLFCANRENADYKQFVCFLPIHISKEILEHLHSMIFLLKMEKKKSGTYLLTKMAL